MSKRFKLMSNKLNISIPKILQTGGGSTGELVRSMDWENHPLGPIENWPFELLNALGIMFSSKQPMFMWWSDELYQFYNDAYLPSFGNEKHPQAMGQRGEECWPENWAIIKPQIDLVMQEGGSTWNDNHLVPFFRDGAVQEIYWTYGYSPIFNLDRKPVGVLTICTETTSEMTIKNALAASEERLNLALESGNIGFWDLDLKNDHVFLSDSLMNAWGVDTKTFKGTLAECMEFIHQDDRDNTSEKILHAITTHGPYDVEYRVIRPDGEIIWINAKGRCFVNPDGSERLTGVTIDITERKSFEKSQSKLLEKLNKSTKELTQAKVEAEKANHSKSAFLANMSHEIRTPLGAILGFTDILKDSAGSKEKNDHYLNIIKRNGQSLIKIIDDILDLSKIEAGKLDVENSTLCLNNLTHEVVDMFTDRADSKEIQLVLQNDGLPNFKIDSDSVRIRQVLVNLVGNAIKFTSVGQVKISAEFEEGQNNEVTVLIRVSDTGIGLNEKQASRLFVPFNQGDNKNSRRFGGTGLGLTLSRKLGVALGGDVYLESFEENKGCTFCFKLIAQKSEHTDAEDLSHSDNHSKKDVKNPLQGMRILAVDDIKDNRNLIDIFLKGTGATVSLASSGMDAIKQVEEDEFDLILLDIQMPGLDGFQTLKQLRTLQFNAPVLALTAHAMKEDRIKTANAGFDNHITKPIEKNKLVDILSTYHNNAAD